MPFDTTAQPVLNPIAAQSALVLDRLELFFRDGAMWHQCEWNMADHGPRCLIEALSHVRDEMDSWDDKARDYLERVIVGNRTPAVWDRTFILINYNDTMGRTWTEIKALIRAAKKLAEADSLVQLRTKNRKVGRSGGAAEVTTARC